MNYRGTILIISLLFAQLVYAQEQSSFDEIQIRVFDQNCITCHYPGSSFAIQSGLVLVTDSSYAELTGELPKNVAAREDGLKRVNTSGGVEGLFQSFLWEKVNAPESEHFYNDHPHYGAVMPLGLEFLTNGELAFIEEWILAGAPDEGAVADTSLFSDTSRYVLPPFVAPDPPQNGFQFHLGPFDVWPAEVHDREVFYFQPFETTEDLYIEKYDIVYRPGSHHFILFNYPEGLPTPEPLVYRDLRDQNGVINFEVALQLNLLFPFYFFVGSQVPLVNYSFPPGVALRLPPGSGFDLNVHSVNRTDTTRIGEVYVNLHTVDLDEVQHVADYDNFGNFDIALPPNQVTTITRTFNFNEQRHIFQMWSHAHEHMTEFVIEGVGGEHDGELLYWTNDWEHPPLLELDPPLTFESGNGLRLITTYNNDTNNWIYYGPLSSDEMQFVFYLYFTGELTGIDDGGLSRFSFQLEPNFPNPFNPSTVIRYSLPAPEFVRLDVFNLRGQKVKAAVSDRRSAGMHEYLWDGTNDNGEMVTSGVYFYKLSTGSGFQQTRKMILMK